MEQILKVQDKEYKIRLTSFQIKMLEQREKKGILGLLDDMAHGSLTEPIIKLLHASLLYYHKDLKIEEVYQIYDDLVEFEHYTMDEFNELVTDIMKSAGLSSGKTLEQK